MFHQFWVVNFSKNWLQVSKCLDLLKKISIYLLSLYDYIHKNIIINFHHEKVVSIYFTINTTVFQLALASLGFLLWTLFEV